MEGGHGAGAGTGGDIPPATAHFFSSGWLKGTEEKTEGRGDSKDTLQLAFLSLGMRTEKGKSWEVASDGWGW